MGGQRLVVAGTVLTPTAARSGGPCSTSGRPTTPASTTTRAAACAATSSATPAAAGAGDGRPRPLHRPHPPHPRQGPGPDGPVLTTQLYFPGEPDNDRDGVSRAVLNDVRDRGDTRQGSFTFVLEGQRPPRTPGGRGVGGGEQEAGTWVAAGGAGAAERPGVGDLDQVAPPRRPSTVAGRGRPRRPACPRGGGARTSREVVAQLGASIAAWRSRPKRAWGQEELEGPLVLGVPARGPEGQARLAVAQGQRRAEGRPRPHPGAQRAGQPLLQPASGPACPGRSRGRARPASSAASRR